MPQTEVVEKINVADRLPDGSDLTLVPEISAIHTLTGLDEVAVEATASRDTVSDLHVDYGVVSGDVLPEASEMETSSLTDSKPSSATTETRLVDPMKVEQQFKRMDEPDRTTARAVFAYILLETGELSADIATDGSQNETVMDAMRIALHHKVYKTSELCSKRLSEVVRRLLPKYPN